MNLLDYMENRNMSRNLHEKTFEVKACELCTTNVGAFHESKQGILVQARGLLKYFDSLGLFLIVIPQLMGINTLSPAAKTSHK